VCDAVVGSGEFLTMWTQGQVFVLHSGQSVVLECEFYAETTHVVDQRARTQLAGRAWPTMQIIGDEESARRRRWQGTQ